MATSQLLPLSQVKAGDVLVDDLYDHVSCRLLLRRGAAINNRVLRALENAWVPAKVKVRVPDRDAASAEKRGVEPTRSSDTSATEREKATCKRSAIVHCCGMCYRELGLEMPREGVKAYSWVCIGCGAVYFGARPANEKSSGSSGNLAGVNYLIDPCRDLTPLPSFECAAKSAGESVPDWRELRAYERFAISAQIPAAPLDEHFRVTGESVLVQLHDISKGGIRVMLRDELAAPDIYLMLPRADGTQLRLIAGVVRRERQVNSHVIGAKWVCRVADHVGIAASMEPQLEECSPDDGGSIVQVLCRKLAEHVA